MVEWNNKFVNMLNQRRFKVTFVSAMIMAVIAHGFAFTNVLHNYDNISVFMRGYGTGLSSGRWLLTLLGDWVKNTGGGYNTPFFNGILTMLLLSITACIIIDFFEIDSTILCSLIGAMFLCFPTVTSTMFFMYTAPYYALAILLAVLAAWFADRVHFGMVYGSILCAFSLGIYQAYLPLTASLLILKMLQNTLSKQRKIEKFLKEGVYFFLTLVFGVLIYWILLKVCLITKGISLSDYQGIDQMGKLTIAEIPYLIKRCYYSFVRLVFSDYCGISQTPLIQKSLMILGLISIFTNAYLLSREKWNTNIGENILLLIVFPIAVNSIILMCPESNIYTLMVYGTVVIYFVPIVLLNILKNKKEKLFRYLRIPAVLMIFLSIIGYTYQANRNYVALYYTTKQTENQLMMLVERARMADGYKDSQKWAFIGFNVEDELVKNPWETMEVYGGNARYLVNSYARNKFINAYIGFDVPMVEQERIEELSSLPEIQQMPCYPDDGSIKVVDDILVIKLENIQ